MQVKTILSILLLLLLYPVQGQSWRSSPWEVYAGFGSANYFGDIGGTADENNWYGIRDIELFRSRPTGIAGLRYNHNRFLSANGSLALGWLSGDDAGGRNETRGYIFNTILFEPAGRIEFFPLKDLQVLKGVNRRGLVRKYGTFSVYIFAGAGAVIYHVVPNEELAARQERDNIDYLPVTMVLPAGAGIKIGVANLFDLGFEIGGRYAMNDYLDGFTSPFAEANDIYYITTFNLIYRLDNLRGE